MKVRTGGETSPLSVHWTRASGSRWRRPWWCSSRLPRSPPRRTHARAYPPLSTATAASSPRRACSRAAARPAPARRRAKPTCSTLPSRVANTWSRRGSRVRARWKASVQVKTRPRRGPWARAPACARIAARFWRRVSVMSGRREELPLAARSRGRTWARRQRSGAGYSRARSAACCSSSACRRQSAGSPSSARTAPWPIWSRNGHRPPLASAVAARRAWSCLNWYCRARTPMAPTCFLKGSFYFIHFL